MSTVAKSHGRKHGVLVSQLYRHALQGYAGTVPMSELRTLEQEGDVLFVAEDRETRAAEQSLSTGAARIDAEQSSAVSGDGSGSVNINVGIVDSGIDLDHPDLNVVGGINCYWGKSFDDGYGHGTETAGVVGALDNGFGVVGVVPGARLWAVRVLGNGGVGNISKLICGIDWITSTLTDSDPTNDIRVVNMSVVSTGGTTAIAADQTVIRNTWQFAPRLLQA